MYQNSKDYNTLVRKFKRAFAAIQHAKNADLILGETSYYLNNNFGVTYDQLSYLIKRYYSRQRLHQLAKQFKNKKGGDLS